jgi:hypothetical protein
LVPSREQRRGGDQRLNSIIRGWAAYYRTQVSSKTFGTLDQYLWQLTYKWAAFSHQNKATSWVIARYFRPFNKARRDRWVFGDRASGAFLHRFAWTNIARHQIVRYRASPDDPCSVLGTGAPTARSPARGEPHQRRFEVDVRSCLLGAG